MAGVWYRTGTIAVTSGSKKITGTGTAWAGAQSGVAKGTLLLLPNGSSVDIYEIDYVESNTVLWLVDNYRGTTGTGKSYAIDITRTDSIPDFSRRLSATLSYHQSNLDVLQQLYTSTAVSITVTAPDGTQHNLIPWKKITGDGNTQLALATAQANRAEQEANRAEAEADSLAALVQQTSQDNLARENPARHPFRGKLPSLALEFARNRYHLVGDYGLEKKTLAEVLTVSSGASTRVDHRGQIVPTAVNQPVIDYDPATGECHGLRTLEQYTNYATNSHTHTSTENADGSQTTTFLDGNPANIYVANTVAAVHRAVKSGIGGVNATIARPHSAFIKIPADSDAIRIWFRARNSSGGGKGVAIDISDKNNPFYVASISSFGPNPPAAPVTQSDTLIEKWSDGWWRIGFIGETSNNSSDVHARLDIGFGRVTSESEPGTINTKLIITGWQLTDTSRHMPYIKTEASAVTRVGHALSRALGSEFNQNEVTVFVQGSLGADDFRRLLFLNNSEYGANNISLGITNADKKWYFSCINGGVQQAPYITEVFTPNVLTKWAFSFKGDWFRVFKDGVLYQEFSGQMPIGLNICHVGSSTLANRDAKVSGVLIYPRAFTAEELGELTKI